MTSIVVGKDRISLLESERYIAGAKQVYKLKVTFSDDWSGLDKKLVFKTDCFEVGLDVCGLCETMPMPWELFAEPTNKLQVGAYGCKCKDKVLTTRWLSLGRVQKGVLDHSHNCCGSHFPSSPSPSTYQELKDLIDRKADRLTYENGQLILWSGIDPLSSFELPISGFGCGESIAPCVGLNIPLGSIIAWSGTTDTIPEGYSLCDGQNGTRDLRNSFILGAGLNLEPGDSGPVDFASQRHHDHKRPNHHNDKRSIDESMSVDAARPYYYALAFIQKTEFTESDLREGKTAYEIAVDLGFTGTEQEWLDSLKGASAYEIAVKYGYVGSEKEFGDSLSAIHPTLKDLLVTRKTELPVSESGAYHFENVTFKIGTRTYHRSSVSAARVNDDMVYLDLRDPNRIVLTSLSNDRVICDLDSNGIIAHITSETFRDQVVAIAGESGSNAPGNDGASAYEIALKYGFVGTEQEWLASLKGADGKSAYQIAVQQGFTGTESQWLASLKGSDGKSAYEIAVEHGFVGTEQEWLDSLHGSGSGEKGDPGESAYEVAVKNGFAGTEQEWLESLKGPEGAKGEKGDSVKMITDYSEGETIVGRGPDGRAWYANVVERTVSATDGVAAIVSLADADLISVSGVISSQNGSASCIIPGFDGAVTYGIVHDQTSGVIELRSTLAEYSDRNVKVKLVYAKVGDDPLSDDELVVNPIVPIEGTMDHNELTNRDAEDQHPIKAITSLTNQLSIRPSQRITEDQIKEMLTNGRS